MNPLPRTLALLERLTADGTQPGWQLYVSLNGEPIADAAGGEARPGVAMTNRTRALWMSAGKPITAVCVLQQVARGKLGLDDRVADHLPDFAAGGKENITIRQCLNHTAGFRGPLNNFTPGTFGEIVARANALRLEPGWTPGAKAGYHVGSSWFVLGALVEKSDGRAIDQYARDEIFHPLDENRATIGLPADVLASEADSVGLIAETEKQLSWSFQGNTDAAIVTPRPGANARGPIRALGRFYESLLMTLADRAPAYAGLLPRELVIAMTSRSRRGMMDETFKRVIDWGLGVTIDSKQYAGEHPYGFGPHASPETFGHGGNQSSIGFADPRFGLVVAWTCNGMPGEARHQARNSALNAAVYEDLTLA